jgi:hypothetical protein
VKTIDMGEVVLLPFFSMRTEKEGSLWKENVLIRLAHKKNL